MDKIQLDELARWKNQDFLIPEDQNSSYRSLSKIVIIGGCGRSGTTLLRVMLDSHSQIASGPESSLFLPVPITLEQLADKFDLKLSALESLFRVALSKEEFIDKFQQLYLRNTNKQIWADKTARNIHRLDYIFTHFPNAKVIHMVRDGRDTICSLLTHRKRRVVDGKIELTGYIMPLQDSIDRWLFAVEDGLKFRGHTNYLEVRYENLVQEPKTTLKQVCDFVGVLFEEPMLNYYTVNTPSRDFMKFPQNIEATKPISTSSIERWKRELNEEDLQQVNMQIYSCLQKLNYI
jgi:hypothetical protein